MRVELYTKPECSLCDEGKAVVVRVCERLSVEWSEASIYASEEVFSRYRYQVPVLCVDGREVATLRFDAAHVESVLRAALDTVRGR